MVLNVFSTKYKVDIYTVILLFFIGLIPYFKYIKKISYKDSSIDLENRTEELTTEVNNTFGQDEIDDASNIDDSFNEFVKYITDLANQDEGLAIVKLNILLESTIRRIYNLYNQDNIRLPLIKMIDYLVTEQIIDPNARKYTMEFKTIANRLNHGLDIPSDSLANFINSGISLFAYYSNIFISKQNDN